MQIGLLIYGSLDSVSGGYLYDRKLVETLRAQGDTVKFVSLPWRNYFVHLGDNFSLVLADELEQLDVDVLLQDELNHPSVFWLNRRLRSRLHYPLVSIVHHLRCSELRAAWQNSLYRQVERAYLKTLDGFVFNSQTTRQVVSQVCPSAAPRPHVVAYPAGDRFTPHVQPGAIEERARQPGPLRLIFLGNLIPRKGLHVLLDALHLLPLGALTLAVIGSLELDPAYTQAMRDRAREYGLEEQVQFLEYLDHAELAGQLEAAQVLVVPSSYEGFGIAYLEGMNFGLPALACQAGAAREIITHGEDGFLVPPENPGILAETLQSLVQDRSLLARLGVSARQRYLRHPGWEQSCLAIRNFLVQEIVRR